MSNAHLTVSEPARQIPLREQSDILVAGGGPAGVAAAITAARAGAQVRLIEGAGCLGGIWTSGLLSYLLDADKPEGFLPELINRFTARDPYRVIPGRPYMFHPEVIKLVLEELCAEAGVRVRYHTRIVSAIVSPAGRLETVITESKAGREAWAARAFIDCTGDGDLGALAGCSFSVGKEDTGEVQPQSLLAMVTGVDPNAMKAEFARRQASDWAGKHALLEAMREGGHEPSYASPGIFHIHNDLYVIMANHQYGVRHDDVQGQTDATIRARAEVDACLQALRKQGGIWKDLTLVATGAQIGVREGRRIHGRASVSVEDLVSGRRQEDGVCRVSFPVDVHALDPRRSKGFEHSGHKVTPYDIPERALIARDVDGLFMAGRCISGDFIAHSSYRVTGNAVAMGEGAGRAAARSIR